MTTAKNYLTTLYKDKAISPRLLSLATKVVELFEDENVTNDEFIEVIDLVEEAFTVHFSNSAIASNYEALYADKRWAPVALGDAGLKPGKTVLRVKPDAYTAGSGLLHNGRIGTYVNARGGYFYIKYGTESSDSVGSPHRAEQVERLIE